MMNDGMYPYQNGPIVYLVDKDGKIVHDEWLEERGGGDKHSGLSRLQLLYLVSKSAEEAGIKFDKEGKMISEKPMKDKNEPKVL